MKNNKTFKYIDLNGNELEKVKLVPTSKIDLQSNETEENKDLSKLSKDELEYKLNFDENLSKKDKKKIIELLKQK